MERVGVGGIQSIALLFQSYILGILAVPGSAWTRARRPVHQLLGLFNCLFTHVTHKNRHTARFAYVNTMYINIYILCYLIVS